MSSAAGWHHEELRPFLGFSLGLLSFALCFWIYPPVMAAPWGRPLPLLTTENFPCKDSQIPSHDGFSDSLSKNSGWKGKTLTSQCRNLAKVTMLWWEHHLPPGYNVMRGALHICGVLSTNPNVSWMGGKCKTKPIWRTIYETLIQIIVMKDKN